MFGHKHKHQSLTKKKSQNFCLNIVPIFSHLDQEELDKIAKATVSASYKKGEHIFLSGETSDALFIIHRGRVKITRLSEAGREQIMRILNPGDFMGELSLFGHSVNNSNAEAMEDTEVCLIRGSEIKKLLVKFPNISLKILEEFSGRLETAESMIEQLGLHDVEQRVARVLLSLAEEQAGDDDADGLNKKIDLTLSISKRDLASMIGTTQETLSRKLSAFQEQGLIEQTGQRRIILLNEEELRRLANL